MFILQSELLKNFLQEIKQQHNSFHFFQMIQLNLNRSKLLNKQTNLNLEIVNKTI